MAQKVGTSKTARMSSDKGKSEKEHVKLPALASSSPSRKAKDIPMPRKPVPALAGGAQTVKASPKSPSKLAARGTRAQLSAPVKPPSMAQPATQQVVDGSSTEGLEGSGASAVADMRRETLPASESSQPVSVEFEGLLISVEDLPAPVDDISHNAIIAAKTAKATEEVEQLRKLNGNGMVKIIYECYDELFPIEEGSTTQANIDEVYCLSFVMPNCLVRLSRHPNAERFEREENGIFDSLVREDPRGTYQDLEKDQTYYVVVEQETDQLGRDQEVMKARWNGELQKQKTDKDDGRGFESCSCIYGNPCVDEYGCRDWHSRFGVASKNGWKGF